ncbi:MAG: hypothetical protein RLZZ221_1929 [Verrucomicrobiota bacterium]
MNIAEVTAKAKVLIEALPYIQDFRGSTFVVKYGGSFMDDPDPKARSRVAYDIAFLAGSTSSSCTAAARPSPARWRAPG